MRSSLLLLVLAVAAPRVARADVVVESLGSVPVSGGDVEAARRRALDDAFRQASDQVIGTLLDPAVRKQHDDAIRKRVLKRAKVYVTQHQVLSEGEAGGVYQVRISATVADAQIATDLRALGIPVLGDAPPPDPEQPLTGAPSRPKLAVIVVGEGAALSGLGARLQQGLAARGFQAVAGAASEVPIDDAESARRAQAAGAGVALVVAVVVQEGGPVRGTALRGAESRAAWRLVGASGDLAGVRLSAQELAEAGVAQGADAAAAAAVAALGEVVSRDAAFVLAQRWPAPAAQSPDAPGVIVWVRGVRRWQEVGALQALLAKAPQVKRVIVYTVGPGEIRLLAVGTAKPQALASALASGPRASLRVGDGQLEVELAPPAVAPPATPGPETP